MSDETPKPPEPGPDSQSGGSTPPPPPTPPSGPPTQPPPPPPPQGQPAPPPGGQPVPAGGYGGAQKPYSVTDAFTFGWKKWTENIGPWIVAAIVAAVAVGILFVIYGVVAGIASQGATITSDPTTGRVEITGGGVAGWFYIIGPILYAGIAIVQIVIGAQFIRAALATARNGKTEFDDFLKTDNLPSVVIAAILIGIAYFVLALIGVIPILGWIIGFVGAIAVAFFTHFYPYFILDRSAAPMDAIRQSAGFVNDNIATIIVLFLATLLCLFIGALLCGIGLLVAMPVVVMAQAYTYRYLTGEGVSA